MQSSLALLLLVPALVAASLPPMPALLWAGSESLLTPGSSHNSISTSSLAQYVISTTGAASAPETLSVYVGSKTPEIVLVFVQPELQTSQLSSLGGAFDKSQGAFSQLKGFVEKSPSVTLPYVYASEGKTLLEALSNIEDAIVVDAVNAVAFFDAHPEIFTNGKSDVVIVKFSESTADLASKFATDDALMGEIVASVSKSSEGAYIALFTAATPGASALAQSLAVARQENVQVRATTHSKAKQNEDEAGEQVDQTEPTQSSSSSSSSSSDDVLYMTPGILSGLLISLLLFLISICGISGLMALQTPDQFEKEGGYLAGQ